MQVGIRSLQVQYSRAPCHVQTSLTRSYIVKLWWELSVRYTLKNLELTHLQFTSTGNRNVMEKFGQIMIIKDFLKDIIIKSKWMIPFLLQSWIPGWSRTRLLKNHQMRTPMKPCESRKLPFNKAVLLLDVIFLLSALTFIPANVSPFIFPFWIVKVFELWFLAYMLCEKWMRFENKELVTFLFSFNLFIPWVEATIFLETLFR